MARTLVTVYRLLDLLHGIENGSFGIPSFQRPFSWKQIDVQRLLGSINCGYPIGMFVTVEGLSDQFTAADPARSLLPAPAGAAIKRLWVIDGSQRLAALYKALVQPDNAFHLVYDLRRKKITTAKTQAEAIYEVSMSSLFNTRDLLFIQQLLAKEPDGATLVSELNGVRERFYSYAVPVLVLSDVEKSDLVNIFASLNSTGHALTKQELESVLNQKVDEE